MASAYCLSFLYPNPYPRFCGYKRGGVGCPWSISVGLDTAGLYPDDRFVFFDGLFKNLQKKAPVFQFIQPHAHLPYFRLFRLLYYLEFLFTNTITRVIMVVATIATFRAFKTPGFSGSLILLAGIATNFSEKRIPQKEVPPKKIRWGNILVFFLAQYYRVFVGKKLQPKTGKNRKVINLFENNYRFGSLVFGGGDVLIPLMYTSRRYLPANQKDSGERKGCIENWSQDFLEFVLNCKRNPRPGVFYSSVHRGNGPQWGRRRDSSAG